jgi:hypothetical protein
MRRRRGGGDEKTGFADVASTLEKVRSLAKKNFAAHWIQFPEGSTDIVSSRGVRR